MTPILSVYNRVFNSPTPISTYDAVPSEIEKKNKWGILLILMGEKN
jgi:hypothetical protein